MEAVAHGELRGGIGGRGGKVSSDERGKKGIQQTDGGKPGCIAPHAPVHVMFS